MSVIGTAYLYINDIVPFANRLNCKNIAPKKLLLFIDVQPKCFNVLRTLWCYLNVLTRVFSFHLFFIWDQLIYIEHLHSSVNFCLYKLHYSLIIHVSTFLPITESDF